MTATVREELDHLRSGVTDLAGQVEANERLLLAAAAVVLMENERPSALAYGIRMISEAAVPKGEGVYFAATREHLERLLNTLDHMIASV